MPGVPLFKARLVGLLARIRVCGHLPSDALCSWGFTTTKKFGGAIASSLRLIHRFCPLAKAYLKAFETRGNHYDHRAYIPPYHFGCLPTQRREAAVAIQMCTNWRLTKLGISFVDTFYDLSNAFGSIKHAELNKTDELSLKNTDVAIAQHANTHTKLAIDAADGPILFQLGEGAAQGHTTAPKKFVRTFARALVPWSTDFTAEHKELMCRCVVNERLVDLSTTVFVDDVAKQTPVQSATDAIDSIRSNNDEFDQAINTIGAKQNRDKQAHVAKFCGPGSKA